MRLDEAALSACGVPEPAAVLAAAAPLASWLDGASPDAKAGNKGATSLTLFYALRVDRWLSGF